MLITDDIFCSVLLYTTASMKCIVNVFDRKADKLVELDFGFSHMT
jgi:hypothetical protein